MKISYIQIFKLLLQLLITNIIILSVFYYWFYDDDSILKDYKFLFGIIIIIFIPFIPQFIVLLNYYYINNNVILVNDNHVIYVKMKEKIIEINTENIVSWQLIGTASKIKKSSIKFSLLDDLFYIKVNLKNNSSIILTSLLFNKIDELFEQKFYLYKVDSKISNFPFIRN